MFANTSVAIPGKGGDKLYFRFPYTGKGFIEMINGIPTLSSSCGCSTPKWIASTKVVEVELRVSRQNNGKDFKKYAYATFIENGAPVKYTLTMQVLLR